jgi:hypothetical protein
MEKIQMPEKKRLSFSARLAIFLFIVIIIFMIEPNSAAEVSRFIVKVIIKASQCSNGC